MKKVVISLTRRPDRKAAFQQNKLQNFEYLEAVDGQNELFRNIQGRKDWVDPFRQRPLQQNEVACFLSHIKAWQRCIELHQPVIVMEDDAIINENWDEEVFADLIKHHDFVYLQRNENEPNGVQSVNNLVEIPKYPYNMTAYLITPKAAEQLLSHVDYNDFIPVDEFLPELISETGLNIVALKKDACNQIGRDVSVSDIETSRPFRNYKVHAVTCGTDRKKCEPLMTSARYHGVDIINIGTNVDWKGTDMKALGGGMKINLMKDWLENIHDDDVVLFTDAYDVFYADDLETIHERFTQMGHDVIFSGEMVCWPKAALGSKFPQSPTRFRFINSGTYIGKAKELKRIMNHAPLEHHEDDQLYVHEAFFTGQYDIGIDYECYIFQTNFPMTDKLGNQLWNPETQCCPCIYHGNGGEEAFAQFESLYNDFYPQQSSLFIPNYGKYEIIGKDMLLVDFMTQEACERLIEIADKHGGWGSLEYDKFPAQEIRLNQLHNPTPTGQSYVIPTEDGIQEQNLLRELEVTWDECIVPVIEKYWKPLQMYGLRDAFVMRYAMDTQVSLNLHHDASLVTGSVKLNDDYEGAELIYPRQNFSNVDIPVGKMILFPGQVTHGHECLPLTSGVKYSLTIWSARYRGDTI